MRLQILGTLPEFRRHGFASRLIRWGMDKAARDDVVLTVKSGSRGYNLYRSLGFRDLGAQIVQVPDEEEFRVNNAMVYEPESRTE
jgi:ribosomal protein S18 acetylase RimI-like enzyme